MFSLKFVLYFLFLLINLFSYCQAVAVAEKCTQDSDCDDFEETTECDDILNICLCNRDHFISRENNDSLETCEPLRLSIGETCKVKQQCTHGVPGELSDCVPDIWNHTDSKICHCNEEISVYDPIEHDCHLIRNFVGDNCKVDSQCTLKLGNLSLCYYTTECQCSMEAIAGKNGTTCLPLVNVIGGECEESQQCTEGKPGNYSDCIEDPDDHTKKVCKCVGGSISDSGKHECLEPVLGTGKTCETDGDCPGSHSVCSSNGKCLCLGGYLHSHHQDDCLQIKNELGESCVESQQCHRGVPGILSACYLEECRCTNFSVNEPGRHVCHRKANLVGDSCQIDEQCLGDLGEKSYCVGGKCECRKDSMASDDLSKCE